MVVGGIHAPGGRVVVVHTNYGRIIVGDSYPKLVVRASVTGLVLGLVLLLGIYGVPALIAGCGALGAWLFKTRDPQSVHAAAGTAWVRNIVGLVAFCALVATPAVVEATLDTGKKGGKSDSSAVINRSAPQDGGPARTDVRGAAPPDGDLAPRESVDPYVVILRQPDTFHGCQVLVEENRARGDWPTTCPATASRSLYAGYDRLSIIVDFGEEFSDVDDDEVKRLTPHLDITVDGTAYVLNFREDGIFNRRKLFRDRLLFSTLVAVPSVTSDNLNIGVRIDDRSIFVAKGLKTITYPHPFWVSVDECLESAGLQREDRDPAAICELPVGNGQDQVRVDVRAPDRGLVCRVTQTLSGDPILPPSRDTAGGGASLKVPPGQDGSAWAITLTCDEGTHTPQTVRIRLRSRRERHH